MSDTSRRDSSVIRLAPNFDLSSARLVDSSSEVTRDAEQLLFYSPPRGGVWDNILHFHDGEFYLYHQDDNPSPRSYGVSTSSDGVHWSYRGSAYEAAEFGLVTADGGSPIWTATLDGQRRHMMQTVSFGDGGGGGDNYRAFLESDDLLTWKLSCRVDLWLGQVIARDSGGFEAFGEAEPDPEGSPRWSHTASDDGLTWTPRPFVQLMGLSPSVKIPVELGGVIERGGRYYFLAGLNDVEHVLDVSGEKPVFNPGCTTLVAESADGPARPALKNRRLMVANNAYFLRFSVLPHEVLVNHITFERDPERVLGVNGGRSYIGPLKLADWDDEGTLRLKYWRGNEKAKVSKIEVAVPDPWSAQIGMIETSFDTETTTIIEGAVRLSEGSTPGTPGIYLQGEHGDGTAFLIRNDGSIEHGSFDERSGTLISSFGTVDREISVQDRVSFRLLRRRKMTEFYVDDYLMVSCELSELGTGRVGLLGYRDDYFDLHAWYCRSPQKSQSP